MSDLVPRFSLREPWERGWNGELSGQLLAPVWYSLLDPQRLPLGIPIKIAIIEKNRKRAGDTKMPLGRREGMVGYLSCSSVEG